MKNKIKEYLLISLIVAVAILDGFSNLFSNIPVIGGIVTSISNIIWEIIELGLLFGLIAMKKRR